MEYLDSILVAVQQIPTARACWVGLDSLPSAWLGWPPAVIRVAVVGPLLH